MKNSFYLFKITLKDVEPKIWRRFVVPSNMTLDRLHDVIQIVMGWMDYHSFEFIISKKHYIEFPKNDDEGLECGKYRLYQLLKRKGAKFIYIYDFGDWWEHELTLENTRYSINDNNPPVFCIEGEKSCPPEDVGGMPGYDRFCKIINDPRHEEYLTQKNWFEDRYGYEFDPDYFDLYAREEELNKFLRWSRDRYNYWD